MERKILELLAQLVALKSTTNTDLEVQVEEFLFKYLGEQPYFQKHQENYGVFSVPGDAKQRRCIFALVKGVTGRTVIFMNHHDTVGTGVYGETEPWACDIQEAGTRVAALQPDSEAEDDYVSQKWIFGRGSCDMKGGLAAQLAVISEYARRPEAGSLLFLSVPDEESYSAGMRSVLPFSMAVSR